MQIVGFPIRRLTCQNGQLFGDIIYSLENPKHWFVLPLWQATIFHQTAINRFWKAGLLMQSSILDEEYLPCLQFSK